MKQVLITSFLTNKFPGHIPWQAGFRTGGTALRFSVYLALALSIRAADLSGEWELTAKQLGDTSYARVTLKVENGKLTGQLNEITLQGTVKGDDLSFTGTRGQGDHFGDFTGKVAGDKLEGTAILSGNRHATWSLKRPATPPGKPQTHDFE